MTGKLSEQPGVAMIGYAFMGAAHSQAWAALRRFGVEPAPAMRLLVGRDRDAAMAAAVRLGWEEAETDWQAALERPDIEIVDICAPGDTHAEIAVAALEAGKHVVCEKPLANSLAEARAMAEAAARARSRGQAAIVGFNYRRVPALALARQWIEEHRLGRLYQVRAAYLQDWAADPELPMVWRMQRERAGSGALGDLGSHVVDIVQYLAGSPIAAVSGVQETFVRERPIGDGDSAVGAVDVDDCTLFSGRLQNGALASFEATRFAVGRKNSLRLELHGSDGALSFDLERMNELHHFDATAGHTDAGFRSVLVTEPQHPYMSHWWPAGHTLGWEHSFTHELADFVAAIAAGEEPRPSFDEGLQVQRVLAAVEQSASQDSCWISLDSETAPVAEAS